MRPTRLASAALCLLSLTAAAPVVEPVLPAKAASPVGRWLTQGRDAVIDIAACGEALCGRIVGITLDRPQDPIPTDYQGRSQCGLTIIQDATRGDDAWTARVVDPRNGSVYRARLQLDAQHRLHLRGYVGIPLFGQTQVWTPFAQAVPEGCRLPAL